MAFCDKGSYAGDYRLKALHSESQTALSMAAMNKAETVNRTTWLQASFVWCSDAFVTMRLLLSSVSYLPMHCTIFKMKDLLHRMVWRMIFAAYLVWMRSPGSSSCTEEAGSLLTTLLSNCSTKVNVAFLRLLLGMKYLTTKLF